MPRKISYLLLFGLLVGYCMLQFVMPKQRLSLLVNYDASCYSGQFSYFEKMNSGSSCGIGSRHTFGFPLVVNFGYDPIVLQVLTVLLNLVPLLLVTTLVVYVTEHKAKQTRENSKSHESS